MEDCLIVKNGSDLELLNMGFWRLFVVLLGTLSGSYAVLRIDTIDHLELTFAQALESGLAWGVYYDIVMGVLALVLVALSRLLFTRGALLIGGIWIAFTWTASLANSLHIRFFDAPLNWWIVEKHVSDLLVVRESAQSLSIHSVVWFSLLFCILGIVLLPRLLKRFEALPRRGLVVSGLALLVLVGWRGPAWLNISDNNPLLGDHIVRAWLLQNTRSKLFQGAQSGWVDAVTTRREQGLQHGWLKAYRNGDDTRLESSSEPGLERDLVFSTEEVSERRQYLGLPEEGPLHVVYLFLESVRAYELEHPVIGPAVFPRLREQFATRGISFGQAYSSSFEAGQTVRGQFSSFCSMLPNIGGAATYIAHTTLSIFCIQDYLKRLNYTQAWFNSHQAGYHNKMLFERRHGTTEFFDQDYFESVGVDERVGSWGLADGPFLQATLDKLEELAVGGKPVFANVLTINTHHPQTVIAEGEVSADLLSALQADEAYHGLLSRYRYTDEAVGGFIERLFSSELGERTLLVVVGDHGARQRPPTAQNEIQHYEARFRVPLVFMTKRAQAVKLERLAHQIDIAPTIAGVLGASAKVAWLGKDLFAEAHGSRWLYDENGLTSYRTVDRGCYPNEALTGLRCVDTRDGDPMFDDLPSVEERPEQTGFFRQVIEELVYVIAYDKVMPPGASPRGSE